MDMADLGDSGSLLIAPDGPPQAQAAQGFAIACEGIAAIACAREARQANAWVRACVRLAFRAKLLAFFRQTSTNLTSLVD
jgi:hypothetical protein